MLWQFIQSFVRHSLTSVGAVLVTKGLASQTDSDTAVGAIMVLIGFGHSLYVKWKAQSPPPSGPQSGPRIPVLFFAVSCAVTLCSTCLLTGCKTTPQQTTYQAAGTTVTTVDAAMKLWGAYVDTTHPGTNVEAAVQSAYQKYQSSFALACDAGAAYAATGGTNATTQAAFNLAIANSSQELLDLENLITSFGVKLQ